MLHSCPICAKKLKLIETITNKCKYCNTVYCSVDKLPFGTAGRGGHHCPEYKKHIEVQKELDLKNKFFKRKLEEI